MVSTPIQLGAAELDAADPLARFRDRFVGAASDLVYFDGNSLGRPVAATAGRLGAFVEQEWGGRLIRGWDEQWMDLPTTLGDDLARVCLGAAAGQTADRRLDHGVALQADARRRRPRRAHGSRPHRDRHRHRQLPDRPLRRRGHRRRARADAAVDRGRHLRGRHRRPAPRGGRRAHRPRRAQPRRVPLGLARRRPGAHPDRPRRRRAGALGPVPLRGRGARRPRRVGRRPRRRLHLQVPQRRPRLPGLRLRQRAPPGRSSPSRSRAGWATPTRS